MNEFEKDGISDEREEEIFPVKTDEGSLDYCDVCFIAFGSQEKRVFLGENVVHPDCAKKAELKEAS